MGPAYTGHRWERLSAPSGVRNQNRHIGSGEAASYRRLPPLEPLMALSRHVPLPVLMGPDWGEVARICGLFLFLGYLSQVGLARVRHRRVREHVHERRLPGLERALEGRAQVVGPLHQLAVPAERLDHLVIAQAGL